MTTPKGWRQGQTMFNFLSFLKEKGYETIESDRMADPFHLSDSDWNKYWNEFMVGKEIECEAWTERDDLHKVLEGDAWKKGLKTGVAYGCVISIGFFSFSCFITWLIK